MKAAWASVLDVGASCILLATAAGAFAQLLAGGSLASVHGPAIQVSLAMGFACGLTLHQYGETGWRTVIVTVAGSLHAWIVLRLLSTSTPLDGVVTVLWVALLLLGLFAIAVRLLAHPPVQTMLSRRLALVRIAALVVLVAYGAIALKAARLNDTDPSAVTGDLGILLAVATAAASTLALLCLGRRVRVLMATVQHATAERADSGRAGQPLPSSSDGPDE